MQEKGSYMCVESRNDLADRKLYPKIIMNNFQNVLIVLSGKRAYVICFNFKGGYKFNFDMSKM